MMESRELIVSVVVPVYNVALYLPYCLESLTSQTLSDIEIICVDDASTDNSVKIVRQFQTQDPRIRLLQQEHRGVSAARNLGIAHARGKYTVFIDADDWTDKDFLQSMVARADQTGSDLVICSACVVFENFRIWQLRRRRSLQAALAVQEALYAVGGDSSERWTLLNRPGSWPFIWNKLIRTDVLRDHAIVFPEGLPLGEDGVFLQVLFQYVQKITFMESTLYYYRYQRKGSATIRLYQDNIKRFEHHVQVVEALLREFSQRRILEKNGKDLLFWIIQFLYADFVKLPSAKRNHLSERIKELYSTYRLSAYKALLDDVYKARLENLLETDKPCPAWKRMYDIIRLKVESRLLRE